MDGEWVSTSAPYIDPHGGYSWSSEAAAQGGRGTQRLAFAGMVTPPPEVAQALGLSEGTEAVARRRVMFLNDRPVELTDSYYPPALAAGTALADPRKIPGGAVKALVALGAQASVVEEEVVSRPATPAERDALELGDGEWVLVLSRLTRSTDATPIEASVMTMPARQRKLRYTMKVG